MSISISYEIDVHRIMKYIKNVVRNNNRVNKISLSIESCHEISYLFFNFTPKSILSETNSEREKIDTLLAKELIRHYPFLGVDQGFEYCNGLLSSIPYNFFQLLAGNFTENESWRLENLAESVNNEFLNYIKN
jgi:hypothetical protein